MRIFLICAAAMLAGLSTAVSQSAFQITGISVEALKNAHKCEVLGGQRKIPTITIRHSKVGGVDLTVHMIDRWEGGRQIDHSQLAVKSSPNGTTVVSQNTPGATTLRAPCNRSSQYSNYFVIVSGNGSRMEKLWARLRTINP